MDVVLLLARLLLAAVFAVAGVAKLADRAGSRRAMADFGLPERLAAPAGTALPVAELLVAGLLLPRATAWWGGVGAMALLLAFVVGIGVSLARGRAPACHCFGQLHSAPAGWSTLARNAALAAIAASIVVVGRDGAGSSVVAWLDDLSAEGGALLALTVAITAWLASGSWLLSQVLRQQGRILVRLDDLDARVASGASAAAAPPVVVESANGGLPVGSPAPAFGLAGLHGETMTLDALRAGGRPVVLVFTDPACGPCNALLPELGGWQRDHGGELTFAVLSRGTVEANRAKAAEHGLAHLLLQRDREVAEAYRTFATPTALLITADGTIGSEPAPGADAIRRLVAQAAGEAAAPGIAAVAAAAALAGGGPARPPTGGPQAAVAIEEGLGALAETAAAAPRPAPEIALPDLDGNVVRLSDRRGRATVVLFWNPGCGFCRQMLDALKARETAATADAPRLLIVSTGAVEENRALGLRSTIVLDPDFAVGRMFGAEGTPSAVLIDASGHLASAVAVGAGPVLALIAGDDPEAAVPVVAAPPVPAIGEVAPPIRLPSLGGGSVDLADFRGGETLVLFWSPRCAFCAEMLDGLREWEAIASPDAPKLLLVSAAPAEAHDGIDLRAPIALDDGFATGRAYGVTGTPSAVLVDAAGRVASALVAGADAVFGLAGYVSADCANCVEECTGRGGGAACRSVCAMGGRCPALGDDTGRRVGGGDGGAVYGRLTADDGRRIVGGARTS